MTYLQKKFRSSTFIIEGSIGVGKTTFVNYIKENASTLFPNHEVIIVDESFQDNPYLSKFYSDPRTYGLVTQKWFLTNSFLIFQQVRARELEDYFLGVKPKITILDRSPFACKIFSKSMYEDGRISKEDYDEFNDFYRELFKSFSSNTFRVFLFEAPVDVSLERIAKRGRGMENGISKNYLERLKNNYENFSFDFTQHLYRVSSGSDNTNFYVETINVINSDMKDI